jgi:diguanylate cyclase (GGDEF)-like protein
LIGLQSSLRVAELAPAFALQVVVGVMLVLPAREEPWPWVVPVGMVAFLASVLLLRDGVWPTPGYSPLLLLPVIWAAMRNRRGELVLAIAGAAVVLFVPIVVLGAPRFPASGWRGGAILLVVASVLGAAVQRLVATVEHQRDEANEMLASQLALRQIATQVATGARPESVFRAVAEQVAKLFAATAGGVVRFDGRSGVGEIVGGWSANGKQLVGQTIELAGSTAAASVYQAYGSGLVPGGDNRLTEPIIEHSTIGGEVYAPIVVGGKLWGAVGMAFPAVGAVPQRTDRRLSRFAQLVAVAIANAQAWETVTRQAATDPLTDLPNHRTFHERLHHEVDRAARHGRALSLALFDLDHFKQINDTYGHQAGDDVLAALARRLLALARGDELVARIGGEEFAWIMPETTQEGAYLAAERARHAIGGAPFEVAGALTTSAGVCSNQHATTAHELFAAADQALYNAKRNGRNATFIYTQDTRSQARLDQETSVRGAV